MKNKICYRAKKIPIIKLRKIKKLFQTIWLVWNNHKFLRKLNKWNNSKVVKFQWQIKKLKKIHLVIILSKEFIKMKKLKTGLNKKKLFLIFYQIIRNILKNPKNSNKHKSHEFYQKKLSKMPKSCFEIYQGN